MNNVRDGSEKVFWLKRDIHKNLVELDKKFYRTRIGGVAYTTRVERQIADATNFLAMLNESPYSNCKTVDELKQRISKRRNALKKQLVDLDENAEGHQISMFENLDELSCEEKEERAKKIVLLKEEIHWLHKCLGICKNKDYFK